MNVKTFFLVCVVAFAKAQYQTNYGSHGAVEKYVDYKDYDDPPKYAYEYKVHDPHTGDYKSQAESREGGVVKGFYTLMDADGSMREVHYTADDHNGFVAEVKRVGHPAQHPSYEYNAHSQY